MRQSARGVARRVTGVVASLVLSVGGLTLVAASPAGAATFDVTNTNDAGPGSLRQAILDAVAANVDSEIEVSDDLDGDTITLTTGELLFSPANPQVTLDIDGNGVVVRQATPASRVLQYASLGQLTLRDLTIRGGRATGGSGVLTFGPMLVLEATFTDNVATAGDGGAIFALFAAVTAKNSTFTDNHARDRASETAGGAIAVFAPRQDALSLIDSTLTDNSATSSVPVTSLLGGGAVAVNGDIDVEGSTIADNTVEGSTAGFHGGGGLFAYGNVSVLNSTITDNTVEGHGGSGGGILVAPYQGILAQDPAIELAYTDVVDNSAGSGSNIAIVAGLAAAAGSTSLDENDLRITPPDAVAGGGVDAQAVPDGERMLASFGSVITEPGGGGDNCAGIDVTESDGWNFADDDSCDLDESTDSQEEGNDPLLGELADNGGPTETLLPAPESPLVNAISPQSCQSGGAHGVTKDQRGYPRPAPDAIQCDIGAVEIEVVAATPLVIEPTFTG